jgi:hypothetical protein
MGTQIFLGIKEVALQNLILRFSFNLSAPGALSNHL